MHTNFIRFLGALSFLPVVVPAFAHGGHAEGFSEPVQHIYAHIGSGWMLVISLIVLGKLVRLFGQYARRTGVGDG